MGRGPIVPTAGRKRRSTRSNMNARLTWSVNKKLEDNTPYGCVTSLATLDVIMQLIACIAIFIYYITV